MIVNKIYQNKETFEEMQNFFNQQGFIQLNNFFIDDMNKIKSKLYKEKFIQIYKPLELKKQELDIKKVIDFDLIKFIEYFKSKEFLKFIEELTNFELNIKNIKINKYSHKDFIILNDKIKNEDQIDILFDLTEDWKKKAGGVLTYTTKEEEVF